MKVQKTIKKIRKMDDEGVYILTYETPATQGFTLQIDAADRKMLRQLHALFEGEASRQIHRVMDFGGSVHVDCENNNTITICAKIGGAKKSWGEPIYFGAKLAEV